MMEGGDHEPDGYIKKSPSQYSCGSVEVYVAPTKNGSANPDDKERISIKSDCMDNRRRLSIINSRGKKVSIENIATSQVITEYNTASLITYFT